MKLQFRRETANDLYLDYFIRDLVSAAFGFDSDRIVQHRQSRMVSIAKH